MSNKNNDENSLQTGLRWSFNILCIFGLLSLLMELIHASEKAWHHPPGCKGGRRIAFAEMQAKDPAFYPTLIVITTLVVYGFLEAATWMLSGGQYGLWNLAKWILE